MLYNAFMHLVEKNLKIIVQVLLLAVVAIVPFVTIETLYFPFVSGKAYVFRALVAVAFFFWSWLLLKDRANFLRAKQSFRHILVIAIIVFFFAQIAASFFGVDPLYSLFSSIERHDGVLQYGFWVLYFFMFLSVFRKERDWKWFFPVFVSTAFALAVYAWAMNAFQTQAKVPFGNPAYFAAFLLFAIGFALLAYQRKLFYPGAVHHGLLAAAGFLTITLVATQVRGVYMGLAGGIVLFSVLSLLFLRKENKRMALASGVVLLAGLISLLVLFAAKDTDFVQQTRLLWRITEVAEFWESDSVRERVLNWNIALKAFREKPVFGYGPENFGTAANKYYDYRIGKGEPWFDRAHNQPFDTLATGGVVVFSAYVFWLGAIGFVIFSIARKEKTLGFLLAGIIIAYFLQGFFLFDLMAVYLGLFPFLAFLIYEEQKTKGPASSASEADTAGKQNTTYPEKLRNGAGKIPNTKYIVLVPVAILSLLVIYATVFIPWRANAEAIQFFVYSESGFFKEALPFAKEAFRIESPYTTWEVRKRAGWQFVQVLEYQASEETPPEKIDELREIYDFITPELEKFIDARPYDPQIYYVLGRMYRFGFEQLDKDDLEKAQAILEQGFKYSDTRVEYYNEYAQVLLLQNKYEKAEQSVKDYLSRVYFTEWFPYVTLGHFYFVAGQYEQAFEQYEKARGAGYAFIEIAPEYSRYMYVAEQAEEYEKVIDMARSYIERWGPEGDTYFNIAVGYLNLGEKETAKDFFLKALELKPEYEEYNSFFLDS